MPEKALFVISILGLFLLGFLLYLPKFGLAIQLSSYIYASLAVLTLLKLVKHEE